MNPIQSARSSGNQDQSNWARVGFFLFFIFALGSGCASSQRAQDEPVSSETSDATEPETSSSDTEAASPEREGEGEEKPMGPLPYVRKPIVLVLGPGMARGFAYAGVFRALHQAKVEIGAIVATEMGALMAALYGSSKTINEFEWTLLKLKRDVFVERNTGLTRFLGRSKGKKIDGLLKQIFGSKVLRQTRIPIKIGIYSAGAGDFEFIGGGRLAEVTRVAISDPELFGAVKWNGLEAGSAAGANPFPIEEARALDLGPVIAVDVLGGEVPEVDAEQLEDREFSIRMKQIRDRVQVQLQKADLVIQPQLESVGFLDFEKRSSAVFSGKLATRKNLSEIQDLIDRASQPKAAGEE